MFTGEHDEDRCQLAMCLPTGKWTQIICNCGCYANLGIGGGDCVCRDNVIYARFSDSLNCVIQELTMRAERSHLRCSPIVQNLSSLDHCVATCYCIVNNYCDSSLYLKTGIKLNGNIPGLTIS